MSTKLTIKEALAVISVSESSLRRDIKKGKVSSEKDLLTRLREVAIQCRNAAAPRLFFALGAEQRQT